MPQENVELTLRVMDAWNRRDVEAMIARSDPGCVWSPPLEGIMEGRTYRGHSGWRQYFKDLAEFLSEESHVEVPEIRDLGDRVLGLGHAWMKFASGVDLDQELALLHTWHNGRAVEMRAWFDHGEALEAAGLRE